MKAFREVQAGDLKALQLQCECDTYGYALIRNLLPIRDVHNLLDEITQIVSEAGWLLSDPDPKERIVNPDAACGVSDAPFESVYERIFKLESFHSLAHHPTLREVMYLLVGPRLLVHPKPIGRLIFPGSERFVIDAHQDHLAIGGDTECFTAWIPLHECPPASGPLQIMEASHRFGFQQAEADSGMIPRERAKGGEWAGGQINAGDVLIFHSLTVHSAALNSSDRLRVSIDCRFQDYERAIHPASLVFPGSNQRSWENTYENWSSDALKYFWKRLPLKLQPSIEELTELAATADSERMRMRYSRILGQILSQESALGADPHSRREGLRAMSLVDVLS